MAFVIDRALLRSAGERLRVFDIRWLIGGSGAGKSTVCAALSSRGHTIIDMDAKIYGSFHARFDPVRHPTNTKWKAAESSLGFQLSMSWPEFDLFQRSALVEYLDLLAEDLAGESGPIVLDGGAWHPAVLVEVLPKEQLACIEAPHQTSRVVWEGEERRKMRAFMSSQPEPDAAWAKFLDFDQAITDTAVRESRELGVRVLSRAPDAAVDTLVAQLVELFELAPR